MKFFTKLILSAVGVAASGVAVNKYMSNKETEMMEGLYGKYVTVFDKRICVEERGEGSKTIVLYPGAGTVSPVLDFRPLASYLAHYYRVITIEPFGYGLSDDTQRERTIENIAEELHETLRQLSVTKYILAAHSLGGS
ncbi:MAG: alpha/beta hydrolase, partial [Erysipelotrichaceae bacterium]|nr:alpha/beta hydrolase [Erysipelotrichaceae bacterium]